MTWRMLDAILQVPLSLGTSFHSQSTRVRILILTCYASGHCNGNVPDSVGYTTFSSRIMAVAAVEHELEVPGVGYVPAALHSMD